MEKPAHKKILIDGIWLAREMKGVGKYSVNVLWQFPKMQPAGEHWVLVRAESLLPALPQERGFHYIPIHYRNHLLHGLWELPRQVRRINADIAWIPYETTVGPLSCPYMVVCHDVPKKILQAKKEGGEKIPSIKATIQALDSLITRRALRRAEKVFCNSHYTGDWLEREAGVRPDRIRYAPCAPGIDLARLRQKVNVELIRQKLASPGGYILVFCTDDQRENFKVIPEVYQKIVEAGFPHNLHVAGVRKERIIYLTSLLDRFTWRDRVRITPFLGSGNEPELAEIYAAASLFLDPSLHEGYGMQVIEAMACRTPVVCSNRGALPEVAGHAAILVDPTKPEEIALAAIRVLSDPDLRDQLVARGLERAATFSWERTARIIHESLFNLP